MPPSDPTGPGPMGDDREPGLPAGSLDRDERRLAAARHQPTGPADDLAEQAELAALRRVGDAARTLQDDDLLLDAPPPAVWEGIAAAVAAETEAAGPAPATNGGPGPAPRTPAPEASPVAEPAPVGDLADRRRSERRVGRPSRRTRTGTGGAGGPRRGLSGRAFLAIAAAVLVVVAIGVGALTRSGDRGPEVVASAALEPLELASSSTLAQLVDADGGLTLDVPLDEAGLPDEAGYYEVWLIDSNVEGMVSLGPAREDGVYDLPPDVSYEDFPIVDVSLEPADGVPTHSGRSVLRGTLASDA
jgi:Anti-sigma-K factor rskA